MKELSKIAIALCATMAFSLAACQTDELSDNATSENTPKVYHVTIPPAAEMSPSKMSVNFKKMV